MGNRAWLCAVTSGVRVCTAHLSLPGAAHDPQQFECNNLRAILRERQDAPIVYAGDTNLSAKRNKGANCMPIGWAGVQDTDHASPPYKTGEEGMQQIYIGPKLTRGNSCGHTRWVPWPDGKQPVPGPAANATDHKSYQLDLYPTAAPSRGVACYRDVRPAGPRRSRASWRSSARTTTVLA